MIELVKKKKKKRLIINLYIYIYIYIRTHIKCHKYMPHMHTCPKAIMVITGRACCIDVIDIHVNEKKMQKKP